MSGTNDVSDKYPNAQHELQMLRLNSRFVRRVRSIEELRRHQLGVFAARRDPHLLLSLLAVWLHFHEAV
jgi:hypothetical protein